MTDQKITRLTIQSPQTDITAACCLYSQTHANTEHLEQALTRSNNWIGIYRNRQEIFGVIWLQTAGNQADLVDILIAQEHRHKGHGTKLLYQTMTTLATMGIETVFLEVRMSNEHAIRLYKTCGFEEIGMRTDYYPASKEDNTNAREDAIMMRKDMGSPEA